MFAARLAPARGRQILRLFSWLTEARVWALTVVALLSALLVVSVRSYRMERRILLNLSEVSGAESQLYENGEKLDKLERLLDSIDDSVSEIQGSAADIEENTRH